MKRNLSMIKYLTLHRWNVFLMCIKLKVPITQAVIHDWTKYLPNEWKSYTHFFYDEFGNLRDLDNEKSKPEFKDAKKRFMKAWKKHVHYHKHHWQAWLNENKQPKEMPEKYIREMVADWIGTGMTLNKGRIVVNEWYQENKDKIILNPKTRERIEEILKDIKDTI
jgi:hypothetical protein